MSLNFSNPGNITISARNLLLKTRYSLRMDNKYGVAVGLGNFWVPTWTWKLELDVLPPYTWVFDLPKGELDKVLSN